MNPVAQRVIDVDMVDVPKNIDGPTADDVPVIDGPTAGDVPAIDDSHPMDGAPSVKDTPLVDDGIVDPYAYDFLLITVSQYSMSPSWTRIPPRSLASSSSTLAMPECK